MGMRRRNPIDEIEQLFERMSRQFEEGDLSFGVQSVAIDLEERPEEFVLTADLPGYDREEIELSIAEDTLRLSAEHEESTEESHEESAEERTYVRKERRRRTVSRSVTLPEPIDEEAASATYTNGVLTVTLPRVGAEESKTIDIE